MQVCEIFDSVDGVYWLCSKLFADVIEEHAPLTRKFIRGNQAPYMNSKLRKAINVKNMLKRRYNTKSGESWENYRKQTYAVVRLRKESKRIHNLRKGAPKQKNFKIFGITFNLVQCCQGKTKDRM